MTHEPDFVQQVIHDLTEGGLDSNDVNIIVVLTDQQVIEFTDEYSDSKMYEYLKELGIDNLKIYDIKEGE